MLVTPDGSRCKACKVPWESKNSLQRGIGTCISRLLPKLPLLASRVQITVALGV